jgi:plasmid stabilization system protein ParE
MAPVAFSPRARQDLLDIGDYIPKDSLANARRFVANLMEQAAANVKKNASRWLKALKRFGYWPETQAA